MNAMCESCWMSNTKIIHFARRFFVLFLFFYSHFASFLLRIAFASNHFFPVFVCAFFQRKKVIVHLRDDKLLICFVARINSLLSNGICSSHLDFALLGKIVEQSFVSHWRRGLPGVIEKMHTYCGRSVAVLTERSVEVRLGCETYLEGAKNVISFAWKRFH